MQRHLSGHATVRNYSNRFRFLDSANQQNRQMGRQVEVRSVRPHPFQSQ